MREDGYTFEENDDPRTWNDGLIPDCEQLELSEDSASLPVLEYLGEFKALIDACGQVSYFFNMRKYVAAGVNKAKIVAAAYQHDLRYYNDQLKEWKVKAERSYGILNMYAGCFGLRLPEAEEKRRLLNLLATSKDRRRAYKEYLDTCLKKNQVLSPEELERKYQLRLHKRFRRANQ